MAATDGLLLNQRKDPRLCFLHNTNRKKIIDGKRLSTHHSHHPGVSSPGINRVAGASSSGHSRGPRTWHHIRGIPYATYCIGEPSQVSNPALGATSSSRDLTDSTEHIKVKSRTGCTQQHQSNKIKMNKDSAPLVKKSGINATPVSRSSKQKEQTTQPPNDSTSLNRRNGTSTILESKQLKLKGINQSLRDPAGLAKKSAISRIQASMHFVKKKETIQSPKSPTDLVENGGTSTTLASKHVMQKKETTQPPKGPAGLVKNTGTRTMASKHVMQKQETAQPPKDLAGLVKNIATSRIPASMHSVQKRKTTQFPKDSAVWVKKSETTTRIPTLKQFTQRNEKTQPSKGSAGLVGKNGTGRTLTSKQVTHKKETIPAKPRQEQHVCEDHIVWEGFDERIVPLDRSCLLCDGDLANEPKYDPDLEHLKPAENAVLSCGHVFHSLCLMFATSEEKSRDPPCIICASILS
ncbi:proteoglycan 4-like isoform X2 [Durio zibethinus]|nr:proteoglycan 4-like isoform X2 [Durio zibethinus]XP_022732502.1 proteoglycan 4-like isoform X2 [Durio zibethinus]